MFRIIDGAPLLLRSLALNVTADGAGGGSGAEDWGGEAPTPRLRCHPWHPVCAVACRSSPTRRTNHAFGHQPPPPLPERSRSRSRRRRRRARRRRLPTPPRPRSSLLSCFWSPRTPAAPRATRPSGRSCLSRRGGGRLVWIAPTPRRPAPCRAARRCRRTYPAPVQCRHHTRAQRETLTRCARWLVRSQKQK